VSDGPSSGMDADSDDHARAECLSPGPSGHRNICSVGKARGVRFLTADWLGSKGVTREMGDGLLTHAACDSTGETIQSRS
jgi:hypothetical protein